MAVLHSAVHHGTLRGLTKADETGILWSAAWMMSSLYLLTSSSTDKVAVRCSKLSIAVSDSNSSQLALFSWYRGSLETGMVGTSVISMGK